MKVWTLESKEEAPWYVMIRRGRLDIPQACVMSQAHRGNAKSGSPISLIEIDRRYDCFDRCGASVKQIHHCDWSKLDIGKQ